MPWALPQDDGELLKLAKSYPFPAPEGSYLFRDGGVAPIAEAEFGERVAVIAHGSNRSPEQLRRKYGDSQQIPVTAAWLDDFDVVYSAHITQYGSIASALCPAPGCRVRIFLNWLTPEQLSRMHQTEGPTNYSYGRLSGVNLELDQGPAPRLAEAKSYMSRRGYLGVDGAPVGMAAVPGENRPHQLLYQDEMLTYVRDRHRPRVDLDELILRAIRRTETREFLVDDMRAEAIFKPIDGFEPGKNR